MKNGIQNIINFIKKPLDLLKKKTPLENVNTENIEMLSVVPPLDRNNLKKDLIVFDNVSKIYDDGQAKFEALSNASFSIDEGELVIILGNSGAGKSTALNMLGGMDSVSSGRILIEGIDISKYSEEQLIQYRRDRIGFVFQFYNLVQNLTIKENVELSSEIVSDHLDPLDILDKVGLKKMAKKFPAQLSGGEQQRASIARAIVKKPRILLCDEPTGALDYKTGKQILQLIQDTCRSERMTVIIITHNSAIAPMGDKVIWFKSGHVEDVKVNPNPVNIGDIEW